MRDLVILGAGGHGREMLDVVEAVNDAQPTWRFLGFLDDRPAHPDRLSRRSAEVLGPTSALARMDAHYVIGIGDGAVRRRMSAAADATGASAAVLVHPTASTGSDVELAPGTVLCAGARVTTNVRVGRHTHLNVNAVASHDCRLADFVTLSPGSAVNGNVVLADEVFLGTGSIITPGRAVGARTWVGAGAVVIEDLPSDVVASGVPARVRRSR